MHLENSEEMLTFAPDDESQNGRWFVIGCSLMQIIAE